MSSSSSIQPSLFSHPLTSIPINPNFSIKLNDTNFLIWREQIKHAVVVYGLQNILEEFESTLSQYMKGNENSSRNKDETLTVQQVMEVNPQFEL